MHSVGKPEETCSNAKWIVVKPRDRYRPYELQPRSPRRSSPGKPIRRAWAKKQRNVKWPKLAACTAPTVSASSIDSSRNVPDNCGVLKCSRLSPRWILYSALTAELASSAILVCQSSIAVVEAALGLRHPANSPSARDRSNHLAPRLACAPGAYRTIRGACLPQKLPAICPTGDELSQTWGVAYGS